MSIAHDFGVNDGMLGPPGEPLPSDLRGGQGPSPTYSSNRRPLHRIADTRRRQGLSLRSVARRLGKSVEQVRQLEEPTSDLLVSELYKWQLALEVPIVELLVDHNAPISAPVLTRARLLRVMKTVRAIKESTKCVSIERLATMLEQQLIEVMPELKDVAAWHSVGQRRSHNELGRIAERVIPESFFLDAGG
jgi:transcriptional regulator with XRE-family HTH domain